MTMASRTRAIVKSEGWAHMKVTVRCNDGTALYPGMVVTRTGHTTPDVGRLDALGEMPFAVLGLPADQDIDTNFTDNDEVVAYMIGSGAVVALLLEDGHLVTSGEKLFASNQDNGYVTPLHHEASMSMNAASLATILPRLARSYVGRAMETLGSYASVQIVWAALV